MNKKLLLGALIGAGISMLNKKMRQQPSAMPDIPPPDFSKVPPPNPRTAGAGSGSLDDILARAGQGGQKAPGAAPGGGGDIFGGAIPAGPAGPAGAGAAGGAAVLVEIARRILAQAQQGGGMGAPGNAPGAGSLNDILGQIFGRMNGKFGQQGPAGQPKKPDAWPDARSSSHGGLFGFAEVDQSGEEQADVMLRAMVAAAQADGKIDATEQKNIIGALQDQLDDSELADFRQMLATPISIDEVLDAVEDPATAFNLYLVSAMTIDQDNPREQQYMDALAQKLGISEQAAQMIESQIPR